MNVETDQSAEGRELLKLLRQYERYYAELQRLAEQQRALIQARQTEDLLTVLSQRQKIVQGIGQIHSRMADYKARWPRIKDALPADLAAEIETLLETLQTMLNDILANDKEDAEQLVSQKSQVKEELNTTSRGNAAANAYAAAGTSANVHRSNRRGLEISG